MLFCSHKLLFVLNAKLALSSDKLVQVLVLEEKSSGTAKHCKLNTVVLFLCLICCIQMGSNCLK